MFRSTQFTRGGGGARQPSPEVDTVGPRRGRNTRGGVLVAVLAAAMVAAVVVPVGPAAAAEGSLPSFEPDYRMSKQYVAVTAYKILRDHASGTVAGCASDVKSEPDRFDDLGGAGAFTRGSINCLDKLGYLEGNLPGGSEQDGERLFEPDYRMSKQYVAVTAYKILRDHASGTVAGCASDVKSEPDRFDDLGDAGAFTRGSINCLDKLGYLEGNLPGGSAGGPGDASGDDPEPVDAEDSLEAIFERAAERRQQIVAALTKGINDGTYGIDDNVLRGPAGFEIRLDDCPNGWSDTEGITDSEIRIGYSAPYSGNLAGYGEVGYGMENYFDWVNENDPVAGRQITLVTKDDAYSAPQTIDNVNAFIATENVFTISTLGTPNTMATYERINEACVPHPFALSGHPAWGDPVLHPWTTGMQFAYSTEAVAWGHWIEQNLQEVLPVKVAGLVMDNVFGASYEHGFAAWAEANPDVVSQFVPVRHDPVTPTLANEMKAITAFEPDVYISMTAGNPCLLAIQEADQSGLYDDINAKGGALFTPSVCRGVDAYLKPAGAAADGWRIIDGGAKDTTDPAYAEEPFIEFVLANLVADELDPANQLSGIGYLYGYPYVEALRIAAELPGGLTRTNLMLAVRTLDIDHPLLHDGIKFRLHGAEDAYFVEGSGILQYDTDSEAWGTLTEIIDLDGQTPNCAWDLNEQRCATLTRDRLTTIASRDDVDVDWVQTVSARALRSDRDGPEGSLKPGIWAASADSYCMRYDWDVEEWRGYGDSPGTGWITVNDEGIEFDQSTRIRIEHGDLVEVIPWSPSADNIGSCVLNWVADLD